MSPSTVHRSLLLFLLHWVTWLQRPALEERVTTVMGLHTPKALVHSLDNGVERLKARRSDPEREW